MSNDTETELSPTQKSMKAIESCFTLIANGTYRIDKIAEVNSCMQFLDELHSQLKAESEAETDE